MEGKVWSHRQLRGVIKMVPGDVTSIKAKLKQ